jgi:hypothetical protein
MSDKLFDQLEGLFAYDEGALDSGVRDEALRAKLQREVAAMSPNELRLRLSVWVREHYLSDDALALGYGIEDAASFWKWIDDGCRG